MCQMQGSSLEKHIERPVELWNQNDETFVQIKHYQTHINYF